MREPNEHLAQARLRKAALLPRAAALAGEGRSYQVPSAAAPPSRSTRSISSSRLIGLLR